MIRTWRKSDTRADVVEVGKGTLVKPFISGELAPLPPYVEVRRASPSRVAQFTYRVRGLEPLYEPRLAQDRGDPQYYSVWQAPIVGVRLQRSASWVFVDPGDRRRRSSALLVRPNVSVEQISLGAEGSTSDTGGVSGRLGARFKFRVAAAVDPNIEVFAISPYSTSAPVDFRDFMAEFAHDGFAGGKDRAVLDAAEEISDVRIGRGQLGFEFEESRFHLEAGDSAESYLRISWPRRDQAASSPIPMAFGAKWDGNDGPEISVSELFLAWPPHRERLR